MKKPKPPKLAEQKSVSAFLMAVFQGANLNAKVRGKSLVESYFDDLLHSDDLSKDWAQFTLKRLKILLTAGADTRCLIRDPIPSDRSVYRDLLFDLTAQLGKLSLLLGSGSIRGEINGYRRIALKSLQQQLDIVGRQLAETRLPAAFEGEDLELYWLADYDYDCSVSLVWRDLTLFSSLLDSSSARQELSGWRREVLDELRQMLYHTSEVISGTELTVGLPEVPDFWAVQKAYQEMLNGLTSLPDVGKELP